MLSLYSKFTTQFKDLFNYIYQFLSIPKVGNRKPYGSDDNKTRRMEKQREKITI